MYYYVFNFTEDFRRLVIDHFVDEYLSGRIPLYHFDAYRLVNIENMREDTIAENRESDYSAIFETGIEEYFYKDGICVVEWAELIVDILPPDVKCIFMEHVSQGSSKEAEADSGFAPEINSETNSENNSENYSIVSEARIYRCTF